MVRIRRPEKSAPVNYSDNVTVGMPIDDETGAVHLRIVVNKKTIIYDELDNFKWLEDSSADGVATIDSPSMQIVIIYDREDRWLREFFAEMEKYRPQDLTERNINDLVQSIKDGSSKKAEHAVEYLAKNRLKIQFNLLNRHDDKDQSQGKKSTTEALADVLELKLQVECHLNKEPLLETIYVRSGTTLYELKEQIESETGISIKDQYWFAFEQYIIDDDYVFGSTKPVVPPRPINAPKKQAIPPKNPIQSGDTLIMCIAQLRPYH